MESLKKPKKLDFKVMSDQKCTKCGITLKQNLVNSSEKVDKCYTCWMLSRGKTTLRIRKKKNSEHEQVKVIDLVEKQKLNKKKYLLYFSSSADHSS